MVEDRLRPNSIGLRDKTLGLSLTHQTRSKILPLKRKVIALFMASLDTMHLSVANERDLQKVKPKENLAKAKVIAAVFSSKMSKVTNMKDWIVDSRATRHICGYRSAFISYTMVKEGEEQVFMGDLRSSPVIGKGKVLLMLTFGKVLILTDILHVKKNNVNKE